MWNKVFPFVWIRCPTKMPSASAKFEKQGSLEVLEPLKQILTVVEKKVRNLEKRKGKLDAYKSDSQNGKELNDDQKKAVEKYDQVVEVLEFAKDMQKQFTSIIQDTSKAQKKVAKREQLERQQHELHRFNEIITIQEILNSMGADDVRQDFLAGNNGAVQLTEEELDSLDELYKLLSPEREHEQESAEFEKQLVAAAEHFQALLDSKNKEVIGSTYKAIREVIAKIHSCTYFNKTAISSSEGETVEAADTNDAKETQETSDVDEGSPTFHAGTESKTEEPSVPPGLSPPTQAEKLYYHADNSSSSFPDQARPIQDVLPIQGNLNFLQESQINLDTTPHPVVSNAALHYPGNFVSTEKTSVSQAISTQPAYQQRTKEEAPGSGHMTSAGQGIPNSLVPTSVPPPPPHLNFAASALQTPGGSTNALGDFDPNRPIPTQTYTNQNFNTAIHPMMAAAAAGVPQSFVPVTLAQMLSAHHGVGSQSVQQQPLSQRGPPRVPPPSLDPSSLVSQSVLPVSTAVSKLSIASQDAKDCFGNREFSMSQVSRERENSHLNQPTSSTPTSQYECLNTHQQGYQGAHNSQAYISRDNFSAENSTYSSNLKRGLAPRGIQRSGVSRGGTANVPRSARGAYRT